MKLRPLINEEVYKVNSPFLNKINVSKILSKYRYNPDSFGSASTNLQSIRATIGEYIERDAVFNNSYNQNIQAFHIITGKPYNIKINSLYLNPHLPSYDYEEAIYNDTCGLATHKNSQNAIENALYEFLERQSLIVNWTGKLNSIKIPQEVIENYLDSDLHLLKDFKLYVRDISQWSFIKVVIFLGYNNSNNDFFIGCSAHHDFKKALEKAYSEAISTQKNKILINELNSQDSVKDLYFENQDSYYTNFFSLSLDEFKNQVEYLIVGDMKMDKDYFNSKPICSNELRGIGIDVYCTYIPQINTKNFKTVKVFSPDGYPSMQMQNMDPSMYKISDELGIKRFPNKFKPIPFP